MIGNTLEEASDLMCGFNFIPEEFGRYYLKKKRAVVDNIPLNEAYKLRRAGTVADILMPEASTFTNEIKIDISLLTREKLYKPTQIIKFLNDDKTTWFVVWDGYKIAPYNGEKIKSEIRMIPYQGGLFDKKLVDSVYARWATNSYRFKNLLTQKKFKKQLELLKPKG